MTEAKLARLEELREAMFNWPDGPTAAPEDAGTVIWAEENPGDAEELASLEREADNAPR